MAAWISAHDGDGVGADYALVGEMQRNARETAGSVKRGERRRFGTRFARILVAVVAKEKMIQIRVDSNLRQEIGYVKPAGRAGPAVGAGRRQNWRRSEG
jgi:hypothetical protein